MAGALAVCSASATEVIGTGGMVVTNGDYVVHTFTNDDTFVFSGGEVEVLLVGGGGGGGSGQSGGGGGGAGGFVHKERLSLWKDRFPIRVGKGGAGCPSYADCKSDTPSLPENGGDTEAFGLVAHGGGHGANTASAIGADGASGGGGANKYLTSTRQCNAGGQALYAEEGHAGGSSTNGLTSSGTRGIVHAWSGGGGGAGKAGTDGVCMVDTGADRDTTGRAGEGGDGLLCAITGEKLYYAGGGGGGFADYSNPSEAGTVSGGQGGGGAGSGARTSGGTPWPGINGTDGFGGGGGGGGAFGTQKFGAGGNGGCGTVIVRYRRELPDEGSVVAEGADVSYDDDVTSVIYTFKGNGTFSVSGGALVDVLLVGGGGGGGSGLAGGGGGGAGGFIYHQSQYVADGTYEIVVGNGGAGGQPIADDDVVAATDAENGENTQAFGLVAHGGGAGGRSVKYAEQTGTMSGKDGGSGGGAAPLYFGAKVATYLGGAACEGEGFGGGRSTNVLTSTGKQGVSHCWSGGGGGAGKAGGDGVCTLEAGAGAETTGKAGKGGDGLPCSITGKELYYAGGGGGGFADWSNPSEAGTVSGGLGGGGAGSGGRTAGSAWPGCNGTDGLGGGGGGGGASYVANNAKAAGGKGGKGVVIVRCRYQARPFEKVVTQGAKRSRDGDYRVFTFTNNGTISLTGDSVVDVLLVGGGGGGGSGRTGGGGGGAGGFLYKTRIMVTNGTYQIVVGDGGAGGANYETDAENGGDTRALGFLVHGGGAGGRGVAKNGGPGADGASGGGGASQYQSGKIVTSPGGEGIETEGCGGGCSTNEVVLIQTAQSPTPMPSRGNYHVYAGGGGGAGAKGADAWIVKSGDTEEDIVGAAGRGGDGLPCSITGTELYYAGGGGGGYADKTDPSEAGTVEGGRGGGGKGSGGRTSADPWPGLPGKDGFGGGGGGAGSYENRFGGVGGKGGAGTVIVRCQVVPSDKGLILLFR